MTNDPNVPDNPKRIQDVLQAALSSPDEASREALLQREYGDDEAMLNRLRELLKAPDATAGYNQPAHGCVRAADLLVDSQRRVKYFGLSKVLLQLMTELERSTQDRISMEFMTTALNWVGSLDDRAIIGSSELQYAVMAIVNQRRLATLLQHPAVGRSHELREFLLQRFEELVLHDGRRVHLPLPKFDEESTVPSADDTNATSSDATDATPADKTPRQFHTIHDAAAWIEKNWPDFNLEATHPVTWRP